MSRIEPLTKSRGSTIVAAAFQLPKKDVLTFGDDVRDDEFSWESDDELTIAAYLRGCIRSEANSKVCAGSLIRTVLWSDASACPA